MRKRAFRNKTKTGSNPRSRLKKSDIRHDSGYKSGTKLSTKTSTGGHDRDTKPAATNPHPYVADTMMEHKATEEQYTVTFESGSK